MVPCRSRSAAANGSGPSPRAASNRCRNTLRMGIRPFLMSWFTWPGEIPHGDAALGLAQLRGAGPQPVGHRAEQAGERSDLVAPLAVEGHIETVHVDLAGPLSELREWPADTHGDRAAQHQRDGDRDGHGGEERQVYPATQRPQ